MNFINIIICGYAIRNTYNKVWDVFQVFHLNHNHKHYWTWTLLSSTFLCCMENSSVCLRIGITIYREPSCALNGTPKLSDFKPFMLTICWNILILEFQLKTSLLLIYMNQDNEQLIFNIKLENIWIQNYLILHCSFQKLCMMFSFLEDIEWCTTLYMQPQILFLLHVA